MSNMNEFYMSDNDDDSDDCTHSTDICEERLACVTNATIGIDNDNDDMISKDDFPHTCRIRKIQISNRFIHLPLSVLLFVLLGVIAGILQGWIAYRHDEEQQQQQQQQKQQQQLILMRELFTHSNKIFINVGDSSNFEDNVLPTNTTASSSSSSSDDTNSTTTTWLPDAYANGGQINTTTVVDASNVLVVLNPWNNDNYGSTINETCNLMKLMNQDSNTIMNMYSSYRYGTNTGILTSLLGIVFRRLRRPQKSFQYEIPIRNGYYNISFYMLLENLHIDVPHDSKLIQLSSSSSTQQQEVEPSFNVQIEENVNYTLTNVVHLSKQQYLLNYYTDDDTEDSDIETSSTGDSDHVVIDQLPIQISMSNVMVRDGWLSINFYPNLDHLSRWNIFRRLFYNRFTIADEAIPTVSGIEISYVSSSQDITLAPVGPPVAPPVRIGPPSILFDTLHVDVGSDQNYTDIYGTNWISDQYFIGGTTVADALDGNNTQPNITIPPTFLIDETVLQSIRIGQQFKYNIPVPPGNYDIRMYFIEYNADATGRNVTLEQQRRIFDIYIESNIVYENFNILDGTDSAVPYTALLLSKPYEVTDGDVTIEFLSVYRNLGGTILLNSTVLPILSAIEIELLGVHYAHAVSGGPYRAVVKSNGLASIAVNGNPSHTHAPGLELTQWIWYLVTTPTGTNRTIIGSGEVTTLSLPIGVHTVVLKVVDNGGNDSSETTTITVYGENYPDIVALTPNNGPLFGGNYITITGSGFLYSPNETIVQFGTTQNLTGAQIQILNNATLKVRVPSAEIPSLTEVSVITPIGISKSSYYNYESSVPIRFNTKKLYNVEKPLRTKFGPDGRLYISNGEGQIIRLTLDDDCNIIDSLVAQVVDDERYITGLAFDPTDTDPTRVYFAHNLFFHGGTSSTSGNGINAKISAARGVDLSVVTDIVSGLPVADLDHGIMAIEFDDFGSLYISSGSNTNGGIPGPLTSKSIQKDGALNSAILIAHIYKPGFNGTVTYDARDDGNQVGALGFVEVFAPGFRNPFGMVLHSNGYLYVTDNGPNIGYGSMSMGCDGRKISDVEEEDRLLLVEKGKYYGQPNLKRGRIDPRQCVWRRATEVQTTANGFTPPIAKLLSSATGIIEYQSNHFNGQLRYSLVSARYQGGLYRTVLSEDGRSVIPESIPPVLLTGDDTLDVTMGPDGSMFDTRYASDAVYHYKPFDFFTPTNPTIYTVFPRRGSVEGGQTLTVYGVNLWSSSTTTKIMMGENECVIRTVPSPPTPKKIQCVIPPYPFPERKTVDVTAIISSNPRNKIVFEKGYRYITGKPAIN